MRIFRRLRRWRFDKREVRVHLRKLRRDKVLTSEEFQALERFVYFEILTQGEWRVLEALIPRLFVATGTQSRDNVPIKMHIPVEGAHHHNGEWIDEVRFA